MHYFTLPSEKKIQEQKSVEMMDMALKEVS